MSMPLSLFFPCSEEPRTIYAPKNLRWEAQMLYAPKNLRAHLCFRN